MNKQLMKGNEAIAEAAIRSGCNYFFGYPITPQNEIPEYMAKHLPERGGTFVQAESEVAAINMVYGAAGAGARVMTSSSSPGIALKQEGISYIAGAELPCLIVNVMRGGPGLGGIQPSQGDYFQSTRGGGNGDYRLICYAPNSIQEMVDLVSTAFDKADEYRVPSMLLADGMLGQMMEAVEFSNVNINTVEKPWALTGTEESRKPNIVNSLILKTEDLDLHNKKLSERYDIISEKEVLVETDNLENADLVCVSYGSTSRIVKNAIESCREEGLSVGYIRPITVWPFPTKSFDEIKGKNILVVEMSEGQMIDDVQIASGGRQNVHFFGKSGGLIPTPAEVKAKIKEILEEGR